MTSAAFVPLGSVARFTGGGTPSKSNAAFWTGDIPWVSPKDMWVDEVVSAEDSITLEAVRSSATNLIPENALLCVVRSGILARKFPVAITGRQVAINQDLKAIIPTKRLDARYLFYFLKASEPAILATVTTGATVHRIGTDTLKALEIPLPPLDEQRRIVAMLDEAFAAIATATANAEKNLANARELFERCLAGVFEAPSADWIVEPLRANVRFIDYRGKTPPKREAGVRLITAKNVKMGFVQRQPEEFVDPAAYDSWMTRGFPRQGDVLFTTEAPLGNVAQLDTDERVVIGQRLITMQPNQDRLDRTFLKYMLCSAPLQRAILKQATGATVSGIKAKLLKEILISYPRRMSEQLEIVERLDALYDLAQSLADSARIKTDRLASLKQSLLHRAFSGELSEREPLAA